MDTEAATEKRNKPKTDIRSSLLICSIIAGFVILAVCAIGLGVAKLVLGVIYVHDCELKPLLPIYLIVDFGAWQLLLLGICIFVYTFRDEVKTGSARNEEKSAQEENGFINCGLRLVFFLVPVFLFCWLIAGLSPRNPKVRDATANHIGVASKSSPSKVLALINSTNRTVWAVNVREQTSMPGHCQNTTRTLDLTHTAMDNSAQARTTTLDTASLVSDQSSHSDASHTSTVYTATPGYVAHCVTCDKVLVKFTFIVVVLQWALFGSIFAAAVVILSIFGLIMCLCSAIN